MFENRNESPGEAADEVVEMREALGAVAAAEPAVFWIFQKYDGRWYVRLEGEPGEHGFADRQSAQDLAKVAAARCRSYRIFSQQDDGSFAELQAHWPQAPQTAPRGLAHWLMKRRMRGFLT